MVELCYIDSCSFLDWGKSKASTPTPREIEIGQRIEDLIASPDHRVFASEVTLIEVQSNICKFWRAGTAGADAQWADAVTKTMMTWCAIGRITIVPMSPKAVEHALTYVVDATRQHGRAFASWDALHLYHASVLAREAGSRIKLVSSDDDFEGFLEVFPEFKAFVELVDPGDAPLV